jgi:hypothetical protein
MVSRAMAGITGIIAVGALALPFAAYASHGKVGLWEVTSTTNGPQMSPSQMAQMQAMGMHMPAASSVTVQRCMTAAEVAADAPPPARNKECTYNNVKVEGHTMSGDMVCTGRFSGQGRYSVTYDGDEHYSGTSTMSGTADGHAMSNSSSFEGKWISADCGAQK